MKKNGIPGPLLNKPSPLPHLEQLYVCWGLLSGSRHVTVIAGPGGTLVQPGPIPLSEMRQAVDEMGITDPDTRLDYIQYLQFLDGEYITFNAKAN